MFQDYGFWGALKHVVYSNDLPHQEEVLNVRIQEAVNEMNETHTVSKVYNKLITRAVEVLEVKGYYEENETWNFILRICIAVLLKN